MKSSNILSMTKFQGPKSHIHSIARGFLVKGEEVILCSIPNSGWFFLPGGHIKDGESAHAALLRELEEETGESNYRIDSMIGICENIFSLDVDTSQHEVNFVFKVEVPKNTTVVSKESHIEFKSIPKKDLSEYKILPETLRDGLLEWAKDGKTFYKDIQS